MLEVEDLQVDIAGSRGPEFAALRGVSLTVGSFETVGLVGESGSGKSITCRAVLGLLPPGARVSGGQIRLQGRRIDKLPTQERAGLRGRVVSMIPQDALASLNPVLTIGDQIIETVRRHRKVGGALARGVALDLLARVGLESSILRAYPHELSGGMRQRVVSVIALTGEPVLVLADEPSTALDVTVQKRFVKTLLELKAALGFGLIFVTHDLALISEFTDRINVMYGGRIIESGRSGDVLARPSHPYTRSLIGAIPRLGPTPVAVQPIPGDPLTLWSPITGCSFAPRCPLAHEVCRTAEPPRIAVAPDHRASCWAVAEDA